MSWYWLAWQRYFDFSGYSTRTAFWMFFLYHFLFTVLFIVVDVTFPAIGWWDVVYSIASFVPMLAIIVRRLHDSGRSGWWTWIFVVPAIGPLCLLYLLAQPSQQSKAA